MRNFYQSILESKKFNKSEIDDFIELNLGTVLYQVNDDETVDFFSDVKFSAYNEKELPFKINKATKSFEIIGLKSLKNMPNEVGGDFIIRKCKFKNLKGCPSLIEGKLVIEDTPIKSFKGFNSNVLKGIEFNSIDLQDFNDFPFAEKHDIENQMMAVINSNPELSWSSIIDTIESYKFHFIPNANIYIKALSTKTISSNEVDSIYSTIGQNSKNIYSRFAVTILKDLEKFKII